MIFHLAVGAVFGAVLTALVKDSRQNSKAIMWWGWLLTIGGLVFGVVVVQTIYGFLSEGAPQAALVMGVIIGTPAIVWGVLVNRFVLKKSNLQ